MENEINLHEEISETEAERLEKFLLMVCVIAFIVVMSTHYYQEFTKQQVKNTLNSNKKK